MNRFDTPTKPLVNSAKKPVSSKPTKLPIKTAPFKKQQKSSYIIPSKTVSKSNFETNSQLTANTNNNLKNVDLNQLNNTLLSPSVQVQE
jgi:hypothetical protein